MLNDSSLPQWVVDATTYRVIEANSAAAELWGYPLEGLIGLDAYKFVPVEDKPLIEAAKAANQWGDSGVWRCRKKDGSIFQARIFWHQFEYQGRLCNFVFARSAHEKRVVAAAR
jgi:PAS domain S-box-containing protein